MAKIQLHRPGEIIVVDSALVSDAELAALGLTREAFEAILPQPSVPFNPPVFTPPETGIPERVRYIETYLKAIWG